MIQQKNIPVHSKWKAVTTVILIHKNSSRLLNHSILPKHLHLARKCQSQKLWICACANEVRQWIVQDANVQKHAYLNQDMMAMTVSDADVNAPTVDCALRLKST